MFDNYVFSEGSCKNVSDKEGKVIGFEMKTLITYYRGIPLSMVHDVQVKVDGVEVPRESIKFSSNGEDYFTLSEMETVTTYRWEYGQEATVFVEKEGGLSKGEHEVSLTTVSRVSYIPVPFSGTRTRRVVIE
jgi:hypothetical protein